MTDRHAGPDALSYRRCVGVMLFNREGLVFVGQRIDQTVTAWQMPQGGIDEGETPYDAALRELEEEIGTANVAFLAESTRWLTYDLPPELVGKAWQGRYRGQTLRWFAFRFLGDDTEIDLATEEPEFLSWKWAPIEQLPGIIVPFKRQVYRAVVDEFRHLAQPVDSA